MSPLRRALVAAVAVATTAVLVWPTGQAAALEVPTGPDGDAFYLPPTPLPPGAPGDPIHYREVSTPIGGVSGAKSYLVLYRSTDAAGRQVAVSGTVFVPTRPVTGPRPIVSLAPGTQGLGDHCAPSKLFRQGTEYEQLMVSELLNKGWAVAVTDYEGLGTPGDHTYVVGRSEGPAVLDAVRAATRIPALGLASGGKVAFTGYSQGGGAAAWAAQLADDYAPELDVVGAAAGGVPADLVAVSKQLDGSAGFGLMLAAAVGMNAAYPELDLPSYLNDAGEREFAAREQKCVGDMMGYAGKRIADYTVRDPIAQPDWQARLGENKLGADAPDVPVLLYHSSGDQLVPYAQAKDLHRAYCAAGARVSWREYFGEHVMGVLTGRAGAVAYLADRFAGKPAPTSC
ncbi:lipase family protein [Actinokineospora soli]|uniref:Lipase family protein n=1 Tax=Actinokineospora soli TaxID=1048753 RepID=A0ABW2TLW0_9PSEU